MRTFENTREQPPAATCRVPFPHIPSRESPWSMPRPKGHCSQHPRLAFALSLTRRHSRHSQRGAQTSLVTASPVNLGGQRRHRRPDGGRKITLPNCRSLGIPEVGDNTLKAGERTRSPLCPRALQGCRGDEGNYVPCSHFVSQLSNPSLEATLPTPRLALLPGTDDRSHLATTLKDVHLRRSAWTGQDPLLGPFATA